MDEELTSEELEAEQQAVLDARSNQTNTKIVKTGAKAAANYFTAGKGGKVVDIVSKTKAGGAILEAGGEALTAATKAVPMGDKIQGALNTADDAGAIDMVDKAMDGKAGDVTSATGSSPKSNLSPTANPPGESSSGLSLPISGGLKLGANPLNKIKMVGMISIALLLIIAISNQNATLTLTSGSGEAVSTAENNNNNTFFTDEQIESKLIYVGDSRIVGMKDTLNNPNITYIAETAKGYHWFDETALQELTSYISADTQKFVIIALGINDLGNIDNYINKYTILKNSYQNVKFYFIEIGPIDENLALENGYTLSNAQIEAFNQRIKEAFPSEFIELDNETKSNIETTDGIHYLSSTSAKIHEIALKYIGSKNSITFLGEYPTVNESQVIKGFSITEAIGASGVDSLNSYINAQVEAGGGCTSGGVVGAAIGLIYGLHSQGYHVAYYHGGGHGDNNGVDLKWGTNIGPSIPTDSGDVNLYGGLDCSGFVAWAMNTSGVGGKTGDSDYANYGPKITYKELSPGDLLISSKHVIMVIENKGDYLQCAESAGGGVQFTTKPETNLSEYIFIDMDNYYVNNCTR